MFYSRRRSSHRAKMQERRKKPHDVDVVTLRRTSNKLSIAWECSCNNRRSEEEEVISVRGSRISFNFAFLLCIRYSTHTYPILNIPYVYKGVASTWSNVTTSEIYPDRETCFRMAHDAIKIFHRWVIQDRDTPRASSEINEFASMIKCCLIYLISAWTWSKVLKKKENK